MERLLPFIFGCLEQTLTGGLTRNLCFSRLQATIFSHAATSLLSEDGSAITIPEEVQQYETVTETADGFLITIKNEPGFLMPATGGYENYLYIGGAALVLLGVVYFLNSRKKKGD